MGLVPGFVLLNLQYTLLSFPDVEELEYYHQGRSEELMGSHFTIGGRVINAADSWKFFDEKFKHAPNLDDR